LQAPARPSWQATLIALAFMLLIGATFLTVYAHTGIDEALKAWAALGTLVGIVTGAIPTYFFGATAVGTANERAKLAQDQLQSEQRRRSQLEDRVALLAGIADPLEVAKAREQRADLWID
jgi:hypothetical protein